MKAWDVTGGGSIAIVQALRGEEFQAETPPEPCPICGRGTAGGHRHELKRAGVLPIRKGA